MTEKSEGPITYNFRAHTPLCPFALPQTAAAATERTGAERIGALEERMRARISVTRIGRFWLNRATSIL